MICSKWRWNRLRNAVCTATLAGDDWRDQALVWLRADLDALKKLPKGAAPTVARMLRHWQGDSDLVSVRDADDLSDAWRKLWVKVATLLKQAGQSTK